MFNPNDKYLILIPAILLAQYTIFKIDVKKSYFYWIVRTSVVFFLSLFVFAAFLYLLRQDMALIKPSEIVLFLSALFTLYFFLPKL